LILSFLPSFALRSYQFTPSHTCDLLSIEILFASISRAEIQMLPSCYAFCNEIRALKAGMYNPLLACRASAALSSF